MERASLHFEPLLSQVSEKKAERPTGIFRLLKVKGTLSLEGQSFKVMTLENGILYLLLKLYISRGLKPKSVEYPLGVKCVIF